MYASQCTQVRKRTSPKCHVFCFGCSILLTAQTHSSSIYIQNQTERQTTIWKTTTPKLKREIRKKRDSKWKQKFEVIGNKWRIHEKSRDEIAGDDMIQCVHPHNNSLLVVQSQRMDVLFLYCIYIYIHAFWSHSLSWSAQNDNMLCVHTRVVLFAQTVWNYLGTYHVRGTRTFCIVNIFILVLVVLMNSVFTRSS